MRIGWGWLGALAAMLLATTPALGQNGKKPPPAEIVSIDLGWSNSLLSRDRWQPVTVWITSREKPFSGILTAEFPLDDTQKAQFIVGPVSTTPGMVTPVEIEIAPSVGAREITLTLTNGRFTTKASYAQQPRSDQLQLPRVGMARSGLMVFVGRTSATKAVDARNTTILNGQVNPDQVLTPNRAANPNQPGFDEADIWEQMMPTSVGPDRLPLSWMAYESADVVVCNASDIANLDPRAEAALSKWVESGGRLVVRVNPVGRVWPRFLPTGPFSVPVIGSEQQVIEPGQELKALLPRVVLSNFQSRLLTLTDDGKARGWTTLFSAGKAGQPNSGALVAYGPHGLGMVTLIGFDPANIAALIDDEAIKDVWRRAIRPIIPPHAILGGHGTQRYAWIDPGDTELTGATNAALDRLAVVPPIGSGVFWLIAGFMTLLVIAIGPFDAKFLKRRRLSQYSWLTAIAWITVASLGAILAPRLMRSGETIAGRMVVTDTICDAEGSPLQIATHGLTGIFAGRPMQIGIEGARPGAWLKGVSATPYSYGRQDQMGGLPDLTLSTMTQEADVPLRGAWADTINIPQWSFRSLSDATPMLPAQPTDIGARIRDAGADWEVTLTNVPAAATISDFALRVGDQWLTTSQLGAVATIGRDRTVVMPKSATVATPPPQFTRGDEDFNNPSDQIVGRSPACLPWVRERGQAVDAMVTSGQYACIYLTLDGVPSDLKVVGGTDIREQASRFLRVLTPMPLEENK